MARDTVPVLKRCRSLQLDPVFLGITKRKGKESIRKNLRATKKLSEYGIQLREKQKAKFIYGVLEKPFRNYFEKAKKMSGATTGENLMLLLESRLDNVVYRLGYGRTRSEARQIVGHKHISVNGKTINIPSYQIKAGDKVEIREKFKGMDRYKLILSVTESRIVPKWLSADHESLSGTVVEKPTRDQIDVPINEVLIVELYSK